MQFIKRLFILSAVYLCLSFPISAYIISHEINNFLTLLFLNIIFVIPLMIFADFKILISSSLSSLRILSRWIDILNEWVGKCVAWVTFLVVIAVFTDVVMRYAFKISFVFTQELEWHLFSFIFLIGAGYTLLKDGHVRVDIFYQRLSPKAQAWVNLAGVLLFLLPGCYMIIATSMNFVYNSLIIMEGSPDPGGIPFRFILKSCIPAGFLLVTLQGISLGIKSLFIIIGKEKEFLT